MRHAQLRAFHHVALQGGFSRAAATLNLSQPALSDQVRRLEADHDTLLFHRDGRQITLTKAGHALFALTRRYFEVQDQIAQQLDQSRAALTGRLRIIADSAAHITDALGRFRARHPGVLVQLDSGNSDTIMARLRAYDAEVGVVGLTRIGTDFDAIPLGASPIVGIAAVGYLPENTHDMDLAELAKQQLILRETGSRTRSAVEQAARAQNLRLIPAIEVTGRDAMREVVATGAGIGLVSLAELPPDPRLMRFDLRGVDLMMPETLITLGQRRDVRLIGAFLRSVSEPLPPRDR